MAFSLKDLLKGAENIAGNIVNNTQHPSRIVNNLSSMLGRVGSLVPQGTSPSPRPTKQSPLDASRVAGALTVENTADEMGYTKPFRQLMMGANPQVKWPDTFGAGGQFDPQDNSTQFAPNATDPYTVTHEGLHAAFERKTPSEQAAFAKVAAKATPRQQRLLSSNSQLGNRLYGGREPLTEVHSFLPVADRNSPTRDYYKQYYSGDGFYPAQKRAHSLRQAVGNPYLPKRTPQFGDWQE